MPRDRIVRIAIHWGAPLAIALLAALGSLRLDAGAATMSPVKNPHGSFKGECALCHGGTGWKPARISRRFDHGKFGFLLEGAHAAAECRACHASLEFAAAPAACASCHEDAHRGELGVDCARCHTARSFIDRVQMVQSHRTTRFPLVGSHAAVDCEGCHAQGPSGHMRFAGTDVECVSCHLRDYQTASPSHAGFPMECRTCHTMVSWPITGGLGGFDHSRTRFPLTGAHRPLSCTSCHVGSDFSAADPACVSCHLDDYNGTDHQASGISTNCTDCHGTNQWAGASFDHSTTGFPLTGAHLPLACASCHVGGVFTGLDQACVSCHLDDYNGTTDPDHQASGISTNCTDCHGTNQWAGASFDHAATGFPLTGAHLPLTCTSCHVGGVFTGLSQACVSCHQNDYDGTSDPNHQAAAFSIDCTDCHGTSRWSGADFTQHDALHFPIYSGVHDGRWDACSTCHTQSSSYSAFTCFSCHPHDDQSGTNSRHSGVSGYQYASSACYSCHPDGRR
jgi:hypothetical protein